MNKADSFVLQLYNLFHGPVGSDMVTPGHTCPNQCVEANGQGENMLCALN